MIRTVLKTPLFTRNLLNLKNKNNLRTKKNLSIFLLLNSIIVCHSSGFSVCECVYNVF